MSDAIEARIRSYVDLPMTSRIWNMRLHGETIERFEFPEPVMYEYAMSVLEAAQYLYLTWLTENHDPGDEDRS